MCSQNAAKKNEGQTWMCLCVCVCVLWCNCSWKQKVGQPTSQPCSRFSSHKQSRGQQPSTQPNILRGNKLTEMIQHLLGIWECSQSSGLCYTTSLHPFNHALSAQALSWLGSRRFLEPFPGVCEHWQDKPQTGSSQDHKNKQHKLMLCHWTKKTFFFLFALT